MADETKDGPASEPGPPKMATEGARAEAGAAKTDTAPVPERQAAATSETFKASPSEAAAAEAPAVAGGTNAPVVPPPGPDAAEKAAADAKAEKVAAARAAHAAKLAAEGKPAPAPAPVAAAAAAKATATPAAAGTAPAPKAGKGEDMSRRGFFSWAAVAWVGFSAAIGGCVTAMGRFMFPNVLFEPPTTFKAGYPQDVGAGVVDTRFVDKYGVWIVNNEGKLYALIAICTHLGCPPAWLETQNKFKCPCHGSGYYKSGVNFEGPTPRPLERARIFLSPDDGQIVVDKAQKFQQELGQWEDPNSFISLA
ncbi:MAG TPA: ubiquinol-cytochrome c reductase iron-sulfur subunit [Thermoanaerobaculia bacterium]|jgi:cytochrome b6-f complex iron-sulfur subunit|nr:ubiquinol-cytochrome c reductase iron-sulfur subunit [Thermoanaerobaculia bacterium]